MKAFKGFDKNMKCWDFQDAYETGKEYGEEGIKAAGGGFRACEMPLETFLYFPPGKRSRYCEVDLEVIARSKYNSVCIGPHIKLGEELDIPALTRAHISCVKEKVKKSIKRNGGKNAINKRAHGEARSDAYGMAIARYFGLANAGDYGMANAETYGAAIAGEGGTAAAGNYGAAIAGNYGEAIVGNCGSAEAGVEGKVVAGKGSAALTGNLGSAVTGDFGLAIAGDKGAAVSGFKGSAKAGNDGTAVAGGIVEVGENGIAVAHGTNVCAKGGMGAVLVLVEEVYEKGGNTSIKSWKAVVVDGREVKENTYYRLVDGKLEEADVMQ